MKKSLHINDGRRSRMRHASEIARRKADRARKFGTAKRRALNLVPIRTFWPQMSRRERVGFNLASMGALTSLGALPLTGFGSMRGSPHEHEVRIVDEAFDLIERKISEIGK